MPDKRTYADRAEYLKKAVIARRKKIRDMALEYGGGKCMIITLMAFHLVSFVSLCMICF